MNTYEKIKHWEENEGIDIIKTVGLKVGDYLIDFGCGFGVMTHKDRIIKVGEGMS